MSDREDDRDVGAGVGYYDDPAIDEVLIEYLGDELLGLMLEPPRVPSFAAETVPPARRLS